MTIKLVSPPVATTLTSGSRWGVTVVGDELFISNYNVNPYSIGVYDCKTHTLKRTITTSGITPNTYGSLGTDGTNLFVGNSVNQIVTINKNNGSTISVKTTRTFAFERTGTFHIDLNKDIIVYMEYTTTTNNLIIKKYSTGVTINTYSMPTAGLGGGATIYGGKHIVVSQYNTRQILVSSDISDGFKGLTFTTLTTSTDTLGGLAMHKNNVLFVAYNTSKLYSMEISTLNINKILILTGDNTYQKWDNGWQTVATSEPTEQDYIDNGMEASNIGAIPETAWQELQGEVKLLYYTDDAEVFNANIQTTNELNLLQDDLFQADEVEILNWSEEESDFDLSFKIEKEPYQIIFPQEKIEIGSTLSKLSVTGNAKVLILFNEEEDIKKLNITMTTNSSGVAEYTVSEEVIPFDESILYPLGERESGRGIDWHIIPPIDQAYLENLYNQAMPVSDFNRPEVVAYLKQYNEIQVIYILDENDHVDKLEIEKASEVRNSPTIREYKIKHNTVKEVN